MSSITIHAMDADLEQRLTEEARLRKKSKNQLVKDLLAGSLGMRVQGKFADDYREFCGLWSAQDLVAFNVLQAGNSEVDEADWLP